MNIFRIWDKQAKQFVTELALISCGGRIIIDMGKDFVIAADQSRFTIDFNTGIQDKNGTYIFERDVMSNGEIISLQRLVRNYKIMYVTGHAHD